MRLTPRCKYHRPFAGRDGEQLCETGGWTSIFADCIQLLPLVGVARSYRQLSSGLCWSDHRITHRTNSFIRVLSFLKYRDRPQQQIHCLVFSSNQRSSSSSSTHPLKIQHINRFFTSIHQNLAKDVAQKILAEQMGAYVSGDIAKDIERSSPQQSDVIWGLQRGTFKGSLMGYLNLIGLGLQRLMNGWLQKSQC